MSSAAYNAHLRQLRPALQAAKEAVTAMDNDILEYEQVVSGLKRLEGVSGEGASELGAGIWVDTAVPTTSTVTLDLGLDIHLPLANAEARDYAVKRVEVLKKKRAVLVGREERIQWEIEQFEGAVKEAMARESGQQPQQQAA